MKIATRISGGYVVLSLLALACGAAGYWGVSKLSSSLEFIAGQAWNAADGAMEGTIGIESQMLGIERTLTGDASTRAKELISNGREMEDEALGRMLASGLVNKGEADLTNTKRREFREASDKLMASFTGFDEVNKRLSKNFFAFEEFLKDVEEVGDGEVEQLRRNPNQTISWNTGLRQHWGAADGAMEGTIGTLQRAYFYTRMIRGEDMAESMKGLQDSYEFMTEALGEVVNHPTFRSRKPKGSSDTYSVVLQRHIATHKTDFDAAIKAYNDYNADLRVYQKVADELLDVVEKIEAEGDSKVEGEKDNISSTISGSYFLVFLTVILSVVIAIVGSSWIIRSIMNPLGKTIDALNDIAEGEGDLTRRLNANGNDEISILAAGFNKFADKINGVLVTIRNATDTIVDGAREISAGNTNLSQRTEEQASSLEETASSMEEMTGTVKQNADSAAQAKQLADANRARAANGAEVVHRTVQAMGEINASSNRISDIITTIDGIAFQTNLLALNAAVEAARAGEQGRGFAVVASEVRSLAQRSADAAKEIKGLIEDSVNKVRAGTALVDESGKTLEEIIEGTQKVADIIAEIAAASIEQASGIDQVNNAVNQMDNMTQDNAALVEEAAAASRSMEEQANVLMEQVSYFKLADTGNRLDGPSRKQSARISRPAPASSERTHLDHLRKDKATATKQDSSEWEQF